jgi:hypothetical protein
VKINEFLSKFDDEVRQNPERRIDVENLDSPENAAQVA